MNVVLPIVLFLAACSPLIIAVLLKKRSSKKMAVIINIAAVACVCVAMFGASALPVFADEPTAVNEVAEEAAASAGKLAGVSAGAGLGMLAAALVTAMSCIGAGIAVASSASAAIGAMSENPKVFGKALIFVALAEGVALYGLLISIQILALLK